MFSEQSEGLRKIIWDFQATQVQKNHKKSFLRFPVGTIKKNLNSNMKLFVWQWENTMIPLFHNGKIRIKHGNRSVPLTSLGELPLCFANSTLIFQRFPLFSLQRMLEKILVNVKCRESSQVTHHWSIFSTLTAFPSWVKIRHGKNRENTSCVSPPPNNHTQPHLPWMMITCWDQLSAFLVRLQLVGTNPQPHLHGWWWWSVTKPFLRASATRWSLRQKERRDVQGQGHEGHFFSWLTAHAKANHHLLFNSLQKEISKPSQA